MSLFRKKSIEQILKNSEEGHAHGNLAKHLGVRDLTAFGIAAIIGAGIFTTIGKASYDGGPGVIFLFIFTAVSCSFAAFAYAEFASLIPVSGSAYTYSYVAFGELFAWIIGWALIMEYAIGNVTVAISWSDYFSTLLEHGFNYKMSEWLCVDYFTAKENYEIVLQKISEGKTLNEIFLNPETVYLTEGFRAFANAPHVFGHKIIFDFPALLINIIITILVYRGIKETRNAANAMVLLKVIVVLLVIFIGAFYVDVKNWNPFLPKGVGGLLKGVSAVFFAYIGFDAISTTAEECKNPQKDLPKGILYSIIICTVLYVAIALVITGIVKYNELNVGDPLAYVFEKIQNLHWLGGIVAISAVVAMASVMLVFQLGQPRIWMSMSRDGLLPKSFAKVHSKFKTPSYSTVVTGLLVAIPIFFVDINMVTDICSAGTLFAFCLVCGGVIILSEKEKKKIESADKKEFGEDYKKSVFKIPYINSKFIIPSLFLMTLILLIVYNDSFFEDYLALNSFNEFLKNIPMYFFISGFAIFSFLCFRNNYSLIPSLGLLCCFYMLSQLGYKNWFYFFVWLIIGLIIYFVYGRRHSNLAK